jgi:hypothetical protein
MNFVETFRNEMSEKGKKMDWKLCLEEGTRRLGWRYKNGESLRSQFSKFLKKKASIS